MISRRLRKAAKRIDALYARIPQIACKKLCANACGVVPMTRVELEMIIDQLGYEPRINEETLICPMLTPERLCGVYAVRPMLCRLFGVVQHEKMQCPYGCKPERVLSYEESRELMYEAVRISRKYSRSV